MDNRITNQFNSMYIITNNPDDVIPYKYFTNSFNGIPHNTIENLLNTLNILKSSVYYNNLDNSIINKINKHEYLINTNNSYYKQFLDNYNKKDRFKVLSIMGIKEKKIHNNYINNNNNNLKNNYNDILETINNIISDHYKTIDNLIQLRNTINLTTQNKDQQSNETNKEYTHNLSELIETTLFNKSKSNSTQ